MVNERDRKRAGSLAADVRALHAVIDVLPSAAGALSRILGQLSEVKVERAELLQAIDAVVVLGRVKPGDEDWAFARLQEALVGLAVVLDKHGRAMPVMSFPPPAWRCTSVGDSQGGLVERYEHKSARSVTGNMAAVVWRAEHRELFEGSGPGGVCEGAKTALEAMEKVVPGSTATIDGIMPVSGETFTGSIEDACRGTLKPC